MLWRIEKLFVEGGSGEPEIVRIIDQATTALSNFVQPAKSPCLAFLNPTGTQLVG